MIFTVPDLQEFGANTAGSPAGSPIAATLSATTGAFSLGNRPAIPAGSPPVAGLPASFLYQFSGTITGDCTITAPVPHSPAVSTDFIPGDVVRILTTPGVKAAHTIAVVDGGSGTPTLVTAPSATVNSQGVFINIQLNPAGTHWTLLDFGGF